MANITVSTSPSNVQVNAQTSVISVTTSTSNVVIGDTKILSNAVIRNALSVTDAGGDGSLAYDNSTGVFTYTGISDLQIRSKLSATSPIAYDTSTGNISLLGNANITTSANITASHFIGNGSQLTGVSTLSNSQVQTFIEANGLDASANLTTTANISGANIITTSGAKLLANGDITGAQKITAGGDISTTNGNIIGTSLVLDGPFIDIQPGGGVSNTYILFAAADGIDRPLIEWNNSAAQSFTFGKGRPNLNPLNDSGFSFYTTNNTLQANTIETSGNINSGPLYVTGDSTIVGNLQVNGNIDYVNVEDLLINDNTITLNYGNAAARDAFIYVDRSGTGGGTNAHIKWNETSNGWEFYNGTSTKAANDLLAGVVDDTTPQLGGNLDINSNRILLGNATNANAQLIFGSGFGVNTGGRIFGGVDEFGIESGTKLDVQARGNIDLNFGSEGLSNQILKIRSATQTVLEAGQDSATELKLGANNVIQIDGITATLNGNINYANAFVTGIFTSNANITSTANISGANVIGTYLHGDGSNISGIAGDIAGVTAGVGLSGGGTSGTVTVNLDPTITTATPSGNGSLAYDNSTGVFTFAPADVPNNTDELSEGSTNEYFTTARANSAITAYTGALANLTGNITTTANISGGNLLTDHVISASGQPLQLKGQTDGIELDKTVASAEARIVDIDTTGYGVASADFHTSAPVGTNVPGLLLNMNITSGSNTVTCNDMAGGAQLFVIRQTSTGYDGYTFGQGTVEGGIAAQNTAGSMNAQLKGFSLLDATTLTVDAYFPIGTFITGISGSTVTMSQNATASGIAKSHILIPGAYSTTQDLGFVISSTGAGTLPFSHIAVNNYVASLPQTLSNVTLDACSHATSVNIANVVMRHTADLDVGALSAVRINQALLIGANATPDISSVGVGSATPSDASILGLTLEADGVTTYPTANATPQTKFLINQYTDNSVKALAAVPSWASSFASGNATLDNNQLGAPAFNFKLLNGNKDDRANLEVLGKSVVGKIQWNAVSDGTATGFISGIDTIYPPASITVMMQDDVAQTSNVSAMDYYLGTTYPTSYRNGANVDGGGIPRTFIANKEGNTVIAAKTDGKVTLRPVRDYGDTGTDTSFVQNRYPNELHEYHEFLGASFLSGKAGTLVEIQPKSGETGGSANFNYDSKGDATLRLSSHHANNTVKAQWDITNDESESTLIVRDHTNSATKLEFSALRTEFSTSAKLKNYTTAQINALSSPEAGDLVFNTDLTLICVYNGSAWRKINDAAM